MDIEKEREVFDAYFKDKYPELHKDVFKEDGDDRAIIGYSFAWSAWQAAKEHEANKLGQETLTHYRLQELIAVGVKATLDEREKE